jgi:hypothetical protein
MAPLSYIDRKVRNKFGGKWFEGVVDARDEIDGVVHWHVTYSDGDQEEYSEKELAPLLKNHETAAKAAGANNAPMQLSNGGAGSSGASGSGGGGGRSKRARPAPGSYTIPGEKDITRDASPPKEVGVGAAQVEESS